MQLPNPLVIGWVALTAVWLYTAVWVHGDARRRGSDHEKAWSLGVFVTGVVGLVVYFAVRTDIGTVG